MSKTICKITNTHTGISDVYTAATYVNLNDVYGYICVDGSKVKFFWEHKGKVIMDTLDYFKISFEKEEIVDIDKGLGICVEKGCKKFATKDYNGHKHYVCDSCYEHLNNEFDEEYK